MRAVRVVLLILLACALLFCLAVTLNMGFLAEGSTVFSAVMSTWLLYPFMAAVAFGGVVTPLIAGISLTYPSRPWLKRVNLLILAAVIVSVMLVILPLLFLVRGAVNVNLAAVILGIGISLLVELFVVALVFLRLGIKFHKQAASTL